MSGARNLPYIIDKKSTSPLYLARHRKQNLNFSPHASLGAHPMGKHEIRFYRLPTRTRYYSRKVTADSIKLTQLPQKRGTEALTPRTAKYTHSKFFIYARNK